MGAPVISALLESGFDVVAITRLQSTATFPTRVTVKKVDTTSTAALTEALKSQDAVVSTVGTAAASVQKTLIDAAVAAHVKRFIPSNFGYNTREARGTKVGGLLKAKLRPLTTLSNSQRNMTGSLGPASLQALCSIGHANCIGQMETLY
jgi:ABC-type Na+ efflux pump permease subunit